ncbi:translocase [Halostella sp. JP-L12]|uniref:twin-arginine translocase subunit TatC n=1 Tax=Halostella TaxID=1843185 RepID=UPI000EF80599|nr:MULTISPECIES: twin-arginine translocase subunit TatC [Halostella]NHN46052.1 translocase [Halostella sp. JP-L12]
MSSAIDEDTARAVNSGRETIGAVLSSAQSHLQKVFMVFVIGLVGTIYALRTFVWDFLQSNTTSQLGGTVADGQVDFIVRTPFDVILLQVKIGLLVGVLLAIPFLLYYSRDALAERGYDSVVPVTRARVAGFITLSLLLFAGGVVYAYAVFFPFMFEFLAVNAVRAEIKPSYGIVLYTQFLLLLTASFGLAAQLPLAMSVLSYAEIVPYETFRDKWRYAILGIFAFGALFSPPDPFTQIMWAAPLIVLYVLSLGLAKIVTNARRIGAAPDAVEEGSMGRSVAALVGIAAATVVGTLAAVRGGGVGYANREILPAVERSVVPVLNESLLPLIPFGPESVTTRPLTAPTGILDQLLVAVEVGVIVALLLVLAYTVRVLRQPVAPRVDPVSGAPDPAEIDLGPLDADGVRAAPDEVFAAMTEDEALARAREAMDADEPDKAEAILDRFDEVDAKAEAEEDGAEAEEVATPAGGETPEDDPVTSTTAGMVDAFTEDETTEEDIGGYFYDIRFILESLTSKMFRIVAVFMAVLAGSFLWLYRGGIGQIREDFLRKMPPEVIGEVQNPVIAMHPVEALIFEVKVSTILGAIAVLPMVAYYAWPAAAERGFVSGDRRVFGLWGVAILAGVVGGSAVGYLWVAPTIISYLVADAQQAGMIISYRLKNFFWLIFLTTAGIGILGDILVSQLMFHYGGIVSFESMYERWRIVTILIFALAGVLTPSGVLTMFIVAIPVALVYLLGLGILWVVTLPRRARGRTA